MKKTLRLTGDVERDNVRLHAFVREYLSARLEAAFGASGSPGEPESLKVRGASIRVKRSDGKVFRMRPHEWLILWRGRDGDFFKVLVDSTNWGWVLMILRLLDVTLRGLVSVERKRAEEMAKGNGHEARGLDV